MNEEPTEEKKKFSVEKIKSFINTKWGEFAVIAGLSVFALLFTVIFMSVKFTDFLCVGIQRGEYSFWSANIIYINGTSENAWYLEPFSVYFIVLFVVCLAAYAAAAAFLLIKNKKQPLYAAAIINIVFSLICLVFGIVFGIMRGGAIACCLISIVFAGALLAFLVLRRRADKAADGEAEEIQTATGAESLPAEKSSKFKIILLIDECVSLLILFSLFFIPFYSTGENTVVTYRLGDALSSGQTPVAVSVAFIAAFIAFFVQILCFSATLIDYFKNPKGYAELSKRFVISATAIALAFFVLSFAFTFFDRISGKPVSDFAVRASYLPLVFCIAVLIVHSVFCGKMRSENDVKAEGVPRRALKAEPLFATLAMTAVTLLSLLLKVVQINIKVDGGYSDGVSLTGYELLKDYAGLGAGFQLMAFIEFAVILSSCLICAFAAVGFFARDKSYYKFVKASAVANFLFVLCMGLFGFYFKIAQKVNLESFEKIFEFYELEMPENIAYDVKSHTIYMLIASGAVLAYMMFRGMFKLGAEYEGNAYTRQITAESLALPSQNLSPAEEKRASEPAAVADFDACPAFTELDAKQAQFRAALSERRKRLFENPTLPALVRFVVDYARECRLHLSYSPEDIATFVAGLGASRLAILQGMSGTGKTSLPKVFTEAVMGNCEIVEVESSWRDKNELLGYYNEFSKCFTPKKFTQSLYKARLNPSVITFIVLDEMNLSRIEYYFSDFLSLMENEEDKREIKLLNVKLCRTENGANKQYAGLTDGHTIKIPENVWFIGTANRDESTFEISDKVYDRAQTMNFNKRAPKIHSFGAPLDQRFVTYETLVNLFEAAKTGYEFEAEYNALVQKTEKLLQKYNISFGNRILRQMEDFVKIYCTCFGDKAAVEKDAVEKILLSKVVSKLENKVVENKELLAAEFDKLGLKSCAEFVRKLNED